MLTQKNAMAHAVLAIILAERVNFDRLGVEHYQNGRECGFALVDYLGNRQAVFSENRNSDAIVVYTGTTVEFLGNGHTPTEDSWKNAKYFSSENKYVEAAHYVMEYLGD